jgi:transcriptional regulator with XRE-family HTH domain
VPVPGDARWQSAVADELSAESARNRLSTRDLAGLVGVTPTTMRRYLNGSRGVPWRVLELMCDTFGVKVADVVARAEERLQSAQQEAPPAPLR